jgi:hypothetical protein
MRLHRRTLLVYECDIPGDKSQRHCAETGEAFGWDPRLFFSQVISFIIVAYLLKRFAYKPILAVLEQRRQQIAQANLNAEKIKQQLAEAEQRYSEFWPRVMPKRKR